MQRCFLDTNAWNYLCPSPTDGRLVGEACERLVRCAGKTVEVVSSAVVLEEVMGAARSQLQRYAAMAALMFDTVGHRWLLPLNERVAAEAVHGGLLPEASRYISEEVVSALWAATRDGKGIESIANEVYAQGLAFKQEQVAIREELRRRAVDEGADLRETVTRWWANEVDVGDWVKDIVESAAAKGRVPQAAHAGPEGAPSVWWFMAYKLARIKLNLADNRAIKPSDYLDADNFSCGPYFDLLVTNDKAMWETSALVPDTPFALETFEDFVERL